MTELHVLVPDNLARALHETAKVRGVSEDELASDALRAYLPTGTERHQRDLSFIALGDAPEGFDVQHAEQQLEDEGFVTYSS